MSFCKGAERLKAENDEVDDHFIAMIPHYPFTIRIRLSKLEVESLNAFQREPAEWSSYPARG